MGNDSESLRSVNAAVPEAPECALPIRPASVNESFVNTKCDYFVDVQLWPTHQKLNPLRWLENFTNDERPYAVHLLNGFIYLNRQLTEELFAAAIQNLSRVVRKPDDPLLAAQQAWRAFLDSALFTHVTGEAPNVTDSGFHFLRMVRQVVRVPQERVMSPEKALSSLVAKPTRPVIFVDDFVGSGKQFETTWQRGLRLETGATLSFDQFARLSGSQQLFYCPLVCTDYGRQRIERNCPAVRLMPAHVLGDQYSAFAADSLLWPQHLIGGATPFIEGASRRGCIPDYLIRGFHNLGLAIAFEHCVPDATLPIIYWAENGWKPLIERT